MPKAVLATSVDIETAQQVERLAKQEDRSLSSIIRDALTIYLNDIEAGKHPETQTSEETRTR